MKISRRYLVTIIAGLILTVLAGLSVFKNMEGLASVCVAGIMTILTTYIWAETRRPSNNKSNEKDK